METLELVVTDPGLFERLAEHPDPDIAALAEVVKRLAETHDARVVALRDHPIGPS